VAASPTGSIDGALDAYRATIGTDFDGYRNHACRVAALCMAGTAGRADQIEKIAIAASFHDLGIWTDRTFDYVEPSVRLATAHLAAIGRSAWTDEISTMIRLHHKATPYLDRPDWLVEPFRRADWVDVLFGALSFGLPRDLIRRVQSEWPDAGFHRRLAQLELKRLRTHPWSPLPMLRW
jgi:hypothetical protein